MWWEAASTLHESLWLIGRGSGANVGATREDVLNAFDRLLYAPLEAVPVSGDLLREAWRIAEQYGRRATPR